MRPETPERGGALHAFVAVLEKLYGRVPVPAARGPFEMVLWENVAYLQPDDRRAAAFLELKKRVGTTPRKILAAPQAALMDVARRSGMHPERRAEQLRQIAALAPVATSAPW